MSCINWSQWGYINALFALCDTKQYNQTLLENLTLALHTQILSNPRKWNSVFVTNSDLLIPIFFLPDGVIIDLVSCDGVISDKFINL